MALAGAGLRNDDAELGKGSASLHVFVTSIPTRVVSCTRKSPERLPTPAELTTWRAVKRPKRPKRDLRRWLSRAWRRKVNLFFRGKRHERDKW